MTRRRTSDGHPTRLRSTTGSAPEGRHLHAVPDPPPVLPTLIAGDDEDPPVERWEVLEMSLSTEMMRHLDEHGFTFEDVIDGKVPGFDAEEIIAKAMEETGSYDGPWSPFEGLNP